jgi:hypothetical protein
MSVCVVVKLKADRANLEGLFFSQHDVFVDVSQDGRRQGAVHHLFAASDGEIIIVDEWPSAEAFERFFHGDERIAKLMADGGVHGAPEVSVYEILDSPDRF